VTKKELLGELRILTQERKAINKKAENIKSALMCFAKYQVGDRVKAYEDATEWYVVENIFVDSKGNFAYTLKTPPGYTWNWKWRAKEEAIKKV